MRALCHESDLMVQLECRGRFDTKRFGLALRLPRIELTRLLNAKSLEGDVVDFRIIPREGGVEVRCATDVIGSSNVITVSDGSMAGDSSNNNFVYARNSIVTIAEMTVTGQTAMGSYLAQAGTNGDVRLIDVNFRSNDCADSSGYAGQST